jgi:hypothetical protein
MTRSQVNERYRDLPTLSPAETLFVAPEFASGWIKLELSKANALSELGALSHRGLPFPGSGHFSTCAEIPD